MIIKLTAKLLFVVIIAMYVSRCASPSKASDDSSFAWDMSVENHTGVSNDLYAKDGKHRGMNVFYWEIKDMDGAINQLIKNNIECIALVPYLYQETELTKEIVQREQYGIWTREDSTFIKIINKLHDRNLHVMLKPHLWMSEGWRSNIQMETKEEWDNWFESYRNHMLHYATLANHLEVELFCIGAEFKTSIKEQPEKWNEMIREIKSIYSGKLTYASNWDGEFDDVAFWDQMDYIGIQAYFPLTSNQNPSIEQIKKGWDRYIKDFEQLTKKYNKPILFTEVGYRSDEAATIEPWVWGADLDSTVLISYQTQNRAYEALFQELWKHDWFAGTYFWQWNNGVEEGNTHVVKEFTPRYKPAENTMAKWYGMTLD